MSEDKAQTPPDRVRVAILDQTSGKKYTVVIPSSATASQIVTNLVRQMNLPTEGTGGGTQNYYLALETQAGRTKIGDNETFAHAGVQDGAVIRIMPQMTAGVSNMGANPYFKLKIMRPDGSSIFETDFLADYFDGLIRNLASILVEKKIFHDGEPYNARILPRSGADAQFDKPVILDGKDIADDAPGFLDIVFEGLESPVDPITYLTTQIRSKETNMLYRFDWRIHSLLQSLIRSVTQILLDDGILHQGDRFRCVLSAHAQGRPRIDPVAAVKKLSATPPPSKADSRDLGEITISESERQPTTPPAKAIDDLDIKIEQVEELIKPEDKSTKSYSNVETVGVIAEDEIPIFFKRSALAQAHQSAHVSAKAVEEVGGFLLGKVLRDPESTRLFVEISEVVEADQAKGTYVSLDFNYNAWRQVLDRLDRELKGKVPVGWYHTHLISQALAVPTSESENEYTAYYVPFFSSPDLFIHRNFFPDPWHVALVMDLRCGKQVFFTWHKSEIQFTGGYYLYDESL